MDLTLEFTFQFLMWGISSFSASLIVSKLEIFSWLRKSVRWIPMIGDLVNCIICLSFWFGFLFSLIFNPSSEIFFSSLVEDNWTLYISLFLNGLLSSAITFFLSISIINRIDVL